MRKSLKLGGLLLALLGLAGPGTAVPVSAETRPVDLVLVLDNSGSMRKADPDRLLVSVVQKLAGRLEAADRLGIVLFDQKAEVVLELTQKDAPDFAQKLEQSLGRVDYRGQLTHLPAAIERATYHLRTVGRPEAARLVVFLTDGVVDVGDAAKSAEQARWLREDLTQAARQLQVPLFGIALTEEADFSLIQAVAQATGGQHYRVLSDSAIGSTFDQIGQRIRDLTAESQARTEQAARSLALLEQLRDQLAALAASTGRIPQDTEQTAALLGQADEQLERIASSTDPMPAGSPETVALLQGISAQLGQLAQLASRQEGGTGQTTVLLSRLETRVAALTELAVAQMQAEEKGTLQRALRSDALAWVLLGAGTAILLLLLGIFVRSGKRSGLTARVPEARLSDLGRVSKAPSQPLVKQVTRIGRSTSQNDIVIPMETIGLSHAEILYRDAAFFVRDLRSKNGTFLNGKRIGTPETLGEAVLKHGDLLRFDQHGFQFFIRAFENEPGTRLADVRLAEPARVLSAPSREPSTDPTDPTDSLHSSSDSTSGSLPGRRTPEDASEAVDPSVSEASNATSIVMEHGVTTCKHHPRRRATERCERCGQDFCERCFTKDRQLCGDCVAAVATRN